MGLVTVPTSLRTTFVTSGVVCPTPEDVRAGKPARPSPREQATNPIVLATSTSGNVEDVA